MKEKKEKKVVVAIQWDSGEDWITFRERYGDGSSGPIQNTSLSADDPDKFRELKRKIEGERLGRIIT